MPEPETTAAEPAAEGWFGPTGSRRFHYFGDELRSLCGRWELWRSPQSVGLDWGTAVGECSGDCAACAKALVKRREAATSSSAEGGGDAG